ncbi:hypothetical protein [Halobellus sp. EA9]|uniref:hypothetical protein n=1 Tax=Halobellus sp. EA9 TaxID=3421647 RepID=UPI003EBD4312
MSSDSEKTNIALEEPDWLAKVRPRIVGSRCWNQLRLEAETHGMFLSSLSYLPAILITTIGIVISLLLYAIGYALTRPEAMMSGD